MAPTKQRKATKKGDSSAPDGTALPLLADAPVRQQLFSNGRTSVEYVARSVPVSRLAVTFSHYGSLDLSLPGFAEEFLLKRGYDVLTLKCNTNNWFQDMAADTLAAIVAQLPAYAATLTYGSDMGGYAAMYFADTVGAQTCIALSPQLSIDPKVEPFETRWVGDASRMVVEHEPLTQRLSRTKATHYVVFDPHTFDREHVRLMAASSNGVLPIRMPHSGHPSRLTLAETGLLESTFDKLTANHVPDLKQDFRKARQRSPSYFYAIAHQSLEKGRVATAEGLLAQACKISDRADIHLSYSRVLLRRGRPQKALEILDRVWPKLHGDQHLIAYRAHLQHLNGQVEEAFKSYDAAIARQPDFMPFYQGERMMFRETIARYENEKRLRESALARARAELELHQGKAVNASRPSIIALVAVPIAVLVVLIGIAIGFRLV